MYFLFVALFLSYPISKTTSGQGSWAGSQEGKEGGGTLVRDMWGGNSYGGLTTEQRGDGGRDQQPSIQGRLTPFS